MSETQPILASPAIPGLTSFPSPVTSPALSQAPEPDGGPNYKTPEPPARFVFTQIYYRYSHFRFYAPGIALAGLMVIASFFAAMICESDAMITFGVIMAMVALVCMPALSILSTPPENLSEGYLIL